MYEIKNRIFLEFTKTQKTALCSFLRALAKQFINSPSPQPSPQPHLVAPLLSSPKLGEEEYQNEYRLGEGVITILQKFLEDEKYYLEINSSRFEFLADCIDDENFIKDAKLYIKECVKYYEYKKSQAPLIQAQKEFDKKKRKFLQEVKMSKELPTKKQLSYYKSLCKRYNIEKKAENENGEALSKLDLRNEIERILNEHKEG